MSTLFVSDLDGTLIDGQALLSEYSRKALQVMLAEGLPFTIATARSIVSVQQILADLPMPLPVICFNGAFLSDARTGEHMVAHGMDADVARGIYELLPQFTCVPYIATYDGRAEKVFYNQVINAGMQWYLEERVARRDPRWQQSSNLADAFSDQIIAMTMIHRYEVLYELELAITERFGDKVEMHHFENSYSPGWYWLTVHDIRATKDQAIRSLCDLTGKQDHRVVVFGDNSNDIKMFKSAHHAVAVSNAIDAIKSHAHEIIGSNVDDSVVKYLRANWK